MLKKTLTLSFLVLSMAVAAYAQNSNKPTMYVDKFIVGNGVSTDNYLKVRSAIINALAQTNKFEIITRDTESSLKDEEARRSDERMLQDKTARTESMTSSASDYVMTGNVTACEISSTTYDDGTKSYSCALNYSITVAEAKTSKTIGSKTFASGSSGILSGLVEAFTEPVGSTPEEAVSNALKNISGDINKFIVEYFPLEGIIYTTDYEVKKNKLITCYINLGSQDGVTKGDMFEVYVPSIKVGRLSYNTAGKIKVEEVVAPDLAQCKVVSGQEEIYSAISNIMSLDEATQAEQPIKIKAFAKESLTDKMGKIGL